MLEKGVFCVADLVCVGHSSVRICLLLEQHMDVLRCKAVRVSLQIC